MALTHLLQPITINKLGMKTRGERYPDDPLYRVFDSDGI